MLSVQVYTKNIEIAKAVEKTHVNLNIIESSSALFISIASNAPVESNHNDISGRIQGNSCFVLLFKWWLLSRFSIFPHTDSAADTHVYTHTVHALIQTGCQL